MKTRSKFGGSRNLVSKIRAWLIFTKIQKGEPKGFIANVTTRLHVCISFHGAKLIPTQQGQRLVLKLDFLSTTVKEKNPTQILLNIKKCTF